MDGVGSAEIVARSRLVDVEKIKQIAIAASRNPIAVAVMGFVFPPLGMVCVWLHPVWAKRTKWIAFGVLALLLLTRTGRERSEKTESPATSEAAAKSVAPVPVEAVASSSTSPSLPQRTEVTTKKKEASASAAYQKMVSAAERGGHTLVTDLTGRGRDGIFRVLNASVWHKANGEDDDVLLIAEVAPLPKDSHLLADNFAVRSGVNALAMELHGMLSRACPQDALNFGTDSQGRQYVKTEENGTTRFHANVLVGKEPCEITWVQMNRSVPDSRFSTTMIKTGWTMFTAQTYDQGVDMRESTIRAMRRLITGGSG